MTSVNMHDLETTTKTQTKPTKKQAMNHPLNDPPKRQHIKPDESINNYFNGFVPDELKNGLKSMLLYGLSMPAPKMKRKKMLINLHQSRFTDEYLKKYLHIDMLSGLDDHSKMALVYGMNYIDAYMSSEPETYIEQKTKAEQKIQPPPAENNL